MGGIVTTLPHKDGGLVDSIAVSPVESIGSSLGPALFESASTTYTGAIGYSITGGVPAGTQAGDLLLAFISHQTAINAWTLPSGWSLHSIQAGPSNEISVFYKTATDSEVAPTFESDPTASTSYGMVCSVLRISGADVAAPINALQKTTVASGATRTMTGVTTTLPNTLLVAVAQWDYGATPAFSSWTNSMIERADQGSGVGTLHTSLGVATKELAAAGATGNITVTPVNSSYNFIGLVLAVNPG